MKKNLCLTILPTLLGLICAGTAVTAAAHRIQTARHKGTGDGICLSAADEALLKRTETRVLGPEHATEHAEERIHYCAEVLQPTSYQWLKRFFASSSSSVHLLIDRFAGTVPDLTGNLNPIARLISPFIRAAGANIATPEQVGVWSTPMPFTDAAGQPIFGVGITAVLLHTGKVLFWGPKKSDNTGLAFLWTPPLIDDPASVGVARQINPPLNPLSNNNIWCAGQTLLPNGRVLAAGGNLAYRTTVESYRGLNQIYTFSPRNETWMRQPDMEHGRWYPTVTALTDGRVVITSGYTEAGTAETNDYPDLFTPGIGMDGVGSVTKINSPHKISGLYPHQFLLPDGRIIVIGGSKADNAMLNPADWSWTGIANREQDRYGNGTGVLLPGAPSGSNEIMLVGGRAGVTLDHVVTATTEIYDVPSGTWQAKASLPQPRRNLNTVILPDDTLLTVGGQSGMKSHIDPQLESELYDPATNTWAPMATQTEPRDYHSTALLLPDGRVISAGDDNLHDGLAPGGADFDTVEIFSPPYLFRGARPIIDFAPKRITWGQNFTIGTAGAYGVAKVKLIAPGAVTHGNDMHQRSVELAITSRTSSSVNVMMPPTATILPPGRYMLFLVNSRGVPSVARWVRVVNPGTLQFSTATYIAGENAGVATITVTRVDGSDGVVSVNYATGDVTATAGADYVPTNGTIIFDRHDVTPKTFTVPIADDLLAEPNETLKITLSSPTNLAALGVPSKTTLTIFNND